MKSDLMNEVSMDGGIGSVSKVCALRVHDRLGLDMRSTASGPEESMVVDDRCELRPAQLVETKLTRVLGGSTLPVSHLQMRGMLKQR